MHFQREFDKQKNADLSVTMCIIFLKKISNKNVNM